VRHTFLRSVGFLFLATLLFSVTGLASEDTYHLSFDHQDLIFDKVKSYDRVKLVDGRLSGEPGTPLLPVRFIQIAIPSDLEVESVEVISSEYTELPGNYQIYPAQPFYPLSSFPGKEEDVEFVEPDASIYESMSEYPGKLAEVTNNGFLGGQHITGVALHPLQYIPAEGRLILYTRIEFKLVFKPTSRFPVPVNRRSAEGVRFYSDLAKSAVINPEAVRLKAKGILSQEEEVDFLIITEGFLAPAFQLLAEWKIQKGISTEIKEISWITSNYFGYDDQEKIRYCIRDFYSSHGTRWVLLGGDTGLLPHRNAPVMGSQIPCDLYFSDLDSNWDANGNHIYGESADAVDMYPDVFVGRAPSNDLFQALTFANKCLVYEVDPPTDYQTRILYAAEVLWPGTDAAELKNYIDESFVPGQFEATKLYETSGNLNATTFREALNEGQNIINHSGHADFDIRCITAAIDRDCIGEHFVNNPNGGGYAYCGNTRYGWGLPGRPLEGPGAEFDIEFFRALFDSSTYQVGKTLAFSKIPFIPIAQQGAGEGRYYRWTMFTLLLLGDPTLELWTDTPAELSVNHAQTLFAGMSYFEVEVVQDGALVSCVRDGQILGKAYSSGGSAVVYFSSPPETMGPMQLTVTKHDFLAYHATVSVIPSAGPYVIYHSHQVDDSPGNGNGLVNPGETILMPVTVKNIGIEDVANVSAVLREQDDFVEITDSMRSFGDIDSGMTAASQGDYVFEIDLSCPDSHVVTFELEAASGETSWVTQFLEMVVEPDFVIAALPDTAVLERGDSIHVLLTFTALGGFDSQVDLSHTALPPGVTGFLEPDHLIPTDISLFRIYTAPDVYPGMYPITVTATGGAITRQQEVVLGIVAPPHYGPVWHVSIAGHDSIGNGTEEFPFCSIQKGIESAAHGDTVLVERGRYRERIDFLGKAILVGSRYILDGLESSIESTVVEGDNTGSTVIFESDEDSGSVIRGLTISGGYALYGGGIYCYGSSPTIAENFLLENECVVYGGGAAVYCGYWSSPAIKRNLVAGCSGPAAIFLNYESNASLINNTVCYNSGGGISAQNNSNPFIKNNVVCNNADYGLHLSGDFWDVWYNDVYGQDEDYREIPDQTGVNGNISADPIFVNPSADDYRLTTGSPCIDAGDPADLIPPGGGGRIDMGAFEAQFAGPWTIYHSHQIDDSGGNSNGAVNPGDIVNMLVRVRNSGTQTVYGVTGILSVEDDFVVVTNNNQYFGDIEPEMTSASGGDYSFEVDPTCPDSHQVTFELELTDGSSVWTSHFVEMVADTDFAISSMPDTALIPHGDSGSFALTLASLGGFASLVDLSHSELPPGVTGAVDPNSLVPTDSSVFTIHTTSEAPMGFHSVTVTGVGGGIVHHKQLEYLILLRGNMNGDGAIDIGDVVYLINYLFRGDLPPDPPQSGDVNSDGKLNIADIVYLLNYLYRGGPSPAGSGCGSHAHQRRRKPAGVSAARLWLSNEEAVDAEGRAEIVCRGTFDVDVAGVQLAIEYDSEELTLTPILPAYLSGLEIYSSQKDGLLKLGIVDLQGESNVPAGSGVDLLVLSTEGKNQRSVRIREAVLADRSGTVIPVKIVAEEEKEALRPQSFSLLQNYPNPFNPQTQIRYSLPQACDVKLTIFNLLGQKVRVLVDKHQKAGFKNIHWDGKDVQGVDVASGVYFYGLEAGDFAETKKMLLLK
jgi:hypothetical protein